MAIRVDDVDLVRDRALVERFQAGDPAAFDTLYTRYFQRLVRFCHKRVGDPFEAEEIAQEAFTKALRALPTFEGERRFYPWVTVIASRLCVDAHRRRGRSEPSPSIDPGVVDGGQEKIIDLVDIEILRTAMEELGPRHREVLALREVQGWSYQQIADHYGVTLGTVEALLFRARKALKREFLAVVGRDRNWAAVPVIGVALRRLAAWRTRLDAWSASVLPSISGPGVAAAAIVVTAITGVVVAGVMQGGSDRPPNPSAAVVSITDASAGDGPAGSKAVSASLPSAQQAGTVAEQADLSGRGAGAQPVVPQRGAPPVGPAVVPLVEPDGVNFVDSAEGAAAAQEMPYYVDVGQVLVGADPERTAADLVQTIANYFSEVGQ